MGKAELRIEIDADLLAQARATGKELTGPIEDALRTVAGARPSLVEQAASQRADPAGAEDRARQWAEENAEAIKAYNERIARRGVFGDDLRRW